MKLNGEPKELEMHQKDVETMQERTRDAQWREKKSESENAWTVLKQATPPQF